MKDYDSYICVAIVWIAAVLSYPITFSVTAVILSILLLLVLVSISIMRRNRLFPTGGKSMATPLRYILAILVDLFIGMFGVVLAVSNLFDNYWLSLVIFYLFFGYLLIKNVWIRSIGFSLFRIEYGVARWKKATRIAILFSNIAFVSPWYFITMATMKSNQGIASTFEAIAWILSAFILFDLLFLFFTFQRKRFTEWIFGLTTILSEKA